MIVIDYEKVNSLIQDLGNKHKMSYENIIFPPVKHCIQCASKKELTKNHKPTSVIVCTNGGLEPGTLYQYRCRECKCIYGYDMYGQSEEKFFLCQRTTPGQGYTVCLRGKTSHETLETTIPT